MGAILLIAGLAMLAAIGGFYLWVSENQIVVDKSTNCPVSGPPRSIHMFIIDRSDPISGQQAQRIKQIILGYRDAAKEGDRFDFYVFNGNTKDALEAESSVCRPKDEANQWIENKRRVENQFREKFVKKVDIIASELMVPTTATNSPLLESLRAAVQTSLGPYSEDSIPFRMTLVSDMIQNSEAVSHYRQTPDFAALKARNIWAQLRPNLKGAGVEVVYILRPEARRDDKPIQNRGHQLFWEQLIADSGGNIDTLRFEPI